MRQRILKRASVSRKAVNSSAGLNTLPLLRANPLQIYFDGGQHMQSASGYNDVSTDERR